MAWECGECNRPESGAFRVQWICHHCGKLLCKDHRHLVRDGAFSGSTTTSTRTAVHCQDCRDAYHPAHLAHRRFLR